MSNEYQNITLESLESGIRLLTVNRPKQMNALNTETIEALAAAIQQVAVDTKASVLLITGAGDKAFIAGADISEFQGVASLEARALSQAGQLILR